MVLQPALIYQQNRLPLINYLTSVKQLHSNDSCEMMHKHWEALKRGPVGFTSSALQFRGHARRKITNLARISALPGDNSSSNLQMAMQLYNKSQEA